MRLAVLASALLLASASAATPSNAPTDPMRFFAGRTVSVGRVKVMFHKEFGTHSTGEGRIAPDGSLILVQQVFDDGKPPHERRWRVRQVGPGHYIAEMSEAAGPVTIDKAGDCYRFRFTMKGGLRAEEVMTPMPGGLAASNLLQVRKFGMVVATSKGTIRKIA
jgi:hypothetical protein